MTEEQKAGTELLTRGQLLDLVEHIVSDDFCEELDIHAALHCELLTEREKIAHRKLSAIYRAVHSYNTASSCYRVHDDWRLEAGDEYRALAEEISARGGAPGKEMVNEEQNNQGRCGETSTSAGSS